MRDARHVTVVGDSLISSGAIRTILGGSVLLEVCLKRTVLESVLCWLMLVPRRRWTRLIGLTHGLLGGRLSRLTNLRWDWRALSRLCHLLGSCLTLLLLLCLLLMMLLLVVRLLL
jgi:hypothetical protein